MTLDPMRPEGQAIVRKLVATADVVVANLPPQTLAAMRLDHESLKALKPDIILTTVTAFGHGGPYGERVGFDGVGQVMSGAVYMTGEEEQPYRHNGCSFHATILLVQFVPPPIPNPATRCGLTALADSRGALKAYIKRDLP